MLTRRLLILSAAAVPAATIGPTGALAETLASGSFRGQSNHVASGTVSVAMEGAVTFIRMGPDFRFDGAPDPKVAFGRNGFDASAIIAPLSRNTGAQEYLVPERMNASIYNQVWLWCEQFNVPLGVADLR